MHRAQRLHDVSTSGECRIGQAAESDPTTVGDLWRLQEAMSDAYPRCRKRGLPQDRHP